MSPKPKAKRVQSDGEPVGLPLDGLSPTLRDEVHASLERALRLHKAETIAASVDRKRSTVYRWQSHPEDVPVGALEALARFDPDPEFLARVAGLLLERVSAAAMRRQAVGRALMVVQEIAPGRWGR